MANAIVAQRPAYSLSKMTTTLLLQLIAQNVSADKLQVISFHPGMVFTDIWRDTGLDPEKMGLDINTFDNGEIYDSVTLILH